MDGGNAADPFKAGPSRNADPYGVQQRKMAASLPYFAHRYRAHRPTPARLCRIQEMSYTSQALLERGLLAKSAPRIYLTEHVVSFAGKPRSNKVRVEIADLKC